MSLLLMNSFKRKKIFLTLLMLLFLRQGYPHVDSGLDYRITNRKYVSHIVFEKIGTGNYITFIMTNPLYWSFHADSYYLHYPCGEIPECVSEMKHLDRFLESGYNIGLKLNGTTIREIRYFEP